VVCHIRGRTGTEREPGRNSAGTEEEGGNRRQEEIAGALSVCVKWPERETNSPAYIVDI